MIWTCNHLFEQSHGMPTRCILALLNEAQSSRLWLSIISTFFISKTEEFIYGNFDSYMMLNKSVILQT